ncbi:MAG TPA: hypothetical protein VHQ69_07965, partial [Methylomirabilota bacterium]|nr:hypothetical protein [Methylomirabilota bacterium]
MALSRPLLLALLGVALLGATVFAVQNARDKAADDPAPVAQQTADPASAEAKSAPESSASAAPEELLRAGLTPDALESAAFDGVLSFSSRGERNVIKTSGAFETGGAKEMPKVDVQLSLRVKSMKLNATGGFVTTGDRAWFTRGNTAYAVPQEAWSKIVKARESGAAPAADAPKVNVDPTGWLRNVKSEGTEQMDGVQVTHVSGDVNSAKAITDLAKAMSETSPLPNAERRLRQGGLTDGHLDAWVGDDKIVRRVSLEMSGKGDGGRRVNAAFDLTLSGVNKPQSITRPSKVKNTLPSGAFGQFATGFVGGLGNQVGVTADDLRLGVPNTNAHVKAERAVADNRKVVIFFENPKGFDDRAVERSVQALDRRTKSVVVLTDDVRNAD